MLRDRRGKTYGAQGRPAQGRSSSRAAGSCRRLSPLGLLAAQQYFWAWLEVEGSDHRVRRHAGYFAREFDVALPAYDRRGRVTWTSSVDCFSRSGGSFSSYKTLACSMSWAARAKSGQALSVLQSW